MLEQDFVLTLLQASITGAGLVLAIYALIVSISRRLIEHKTQILLDDFKEYREKEESLESKQKLKALNRCGRTLGN